MNYKKPTIVWEKWVDPFGADMDEAKWTDYNNEFPYSGEDDDHGDGEHKITHSKSKPIRVIATPLGLIPYNEYTASSKIFNFWLGHTNFDISESIKKIIEESEGVEILDIFTRYRFRIAIGKCFNDSETMININNDITKKIRSTT